MEKTITIDGKEVKFKATAAIPRMYRLKFRRDIMQDLKRLESAVKKEDEEFSIPDLEIFENVAFMMAKHADLSIENTPEEWLENFGTFSIYEVLEPLLELWGLNLETQIESKKKKMGVTGS